MTVSEPCRASAVGGFFFSHLGDLTSLSSSMSSSLNARSWAMRSRASMTLEWRPSQRVPASIRRVTASYARSKAASSSLMARTGGSEKGGL